MMGVMALRGMTVVGGKVQRRLHRSASGDDSRKQTCGKEEQIACALDVHTQIDGIVFT